MKVSRNKRQFQINFDSNNEISANLEHEQEKDIIDKFIQPCPFFQFPPVYSEEIEKFKKKVIGSANQYGTRNQKTTAIFLSLLQFSREIATNELKKKEYLTACSYYAMCLGFIDPDDEIFLEKFIVTKIDIINKLMYCLFEMKPEKGENRHLESAMNFIEEFLTKVNQYAFQSNLVKSDVCMIELNYFYLGRVYKKRKNYPRAIQFFLKGQEIIASKKALEIYDKNASLNSFSRNLEIKIFYKISKCYREDDIQLQQIYEGRALKEAEKNNQSLYQHFNRKVRMYKSAKKFNLMLAKIEGKKKIEEEVLRRIEESTQKECSSLYDVYKDRPNNYSCEDIILKDCNINL